MRIAGLQKVSLIDYPDKCSCVVFTSGCNYNCGYCHNPELISFIGDNIPEEDILKYLDSRKSLIDAIVISGGEPTLQNDLPEFAKKAKEKGLLVKLDTNGSNPQRLKELLEKKLIDYVAMDVKAPTELYSNIIGTDFSFYPAMRESIQIVTRFPDYEFRTTIAPVLIKDSFRFMSPEDIFNLSREVYRITSKEKHKYFLQPFRAIEKDGGNERYLKKNLPKEMWETPKDILEGAKEKAKLWLPETRIRN